MDVPFFTLGACLYPALASPSLRPSPHCCLCLWVMHIHSSIHPFTFFLLLLSLPLCSCITFLEYSPHHPSHPSSTPIPSLSFCLCHTITHHTHTPIKSPNSELCPHQFPVVTKPVSNLAEKLAEKTLLCILITLWA